MNVAARLGALRARIAAAAGDRPVDVVAVTKGFAADAIAAAVAAGCSMIGENYAQELLTKLARYDAIGLPRPAIHYIGRLQTNKVRQLADTVDVWESVDRERLLAEIARRRPGATVLIQVNATGEPGKGGCRPDDLTALAERAATLNLDLNGLMTVGPTDGDAAVTERAFDLTRRLTNELGLPTCSMGMTDDLEIALAAGSTRVRVGTALFGRPP